MKLRLAIAVGIVLAALYTAPTALADSPAGVPGGCFKSGVNIDAPNSPQGWNNLSDDTNEAAYVSIGENLQYDYAENHTTCQFLFRYHFTFNMVGGVDGSNNNEAHFRVWRCGGSPLFDQYYNLNGTGLITIWYPSQTGFIYSYGCGPQADVQIWGNDYDWVCFASPCTPYNPTGGAYTSYMNGW